MDHETALRPVDASGIRSVQELNARLADMFTCVDGPPRAFFEIPTGVMVGGGEVVARVTYVTVAFGVVCEDEASSEALLCDTFWRHIKKAVALAGPSLDSHILFWRRRPDFYTERPMSHFDSVGRTEGLCEDLGVPFEPTYGPQCVKLRARLAIPGVMLGGVPEGSTCPMLPA